MPKRFARFLDALEETGDVGQACAAAKVTASSIMVRRRRDQEFAAGFALAEEAHGKSAKAKTFLDVYAKTGNMTESCRLSGLSRADVLARKRDDKPFAEAFEDARLEAVDELEAEARRRAVEGVEDLVIHSGRPVYHCDAKGRYLTDELGTPIPVIKRQYSDKLLETLLKANAPEKFRENMKVDHAVAGGVLLIPADRAPTEEEWERRMGRKRLEREGKTIEGEVERVEG